MTKRYYSYSKTTTVALLFIVPILVLNFQMLPAQTTDLAEEEKQILPLRSGVGITGLTGDIKVHNFYTCTPECDGRWQTELQFEIRNIRMLSRQFGIGYKGLATVFMAGFFEGGGLGGIGAGPLIRFYPLKTTKWQPYLQTGFLAGYNLALSNAIGIGDVDGFRYRADIRAGLTYRVTNALGLFFEIGRIWEYENNESNFEMIARGYQIQIGIELFNF